MFATPWSETFPAQLRTHGYWVGHVGKWHNGKFPAAEYDSPASALANGTHWITQPDGSRIHVTQKNERDAIEFLRARPNDKPFCLTVVQMRLLNPLQHFHRMRLMGQLKQQHFTH